MQRQNELIPKWITPDVLGGSTSLKAVRDAGKAALRAAAREPAIA
jgi:hypothetical protein